MASKPPPLVAPAGAGLTAHRVALAAAAALLLLLSPPEAGGDPADSDRDGQAESRLDALKAGFILNFLKYTQWPEEAVATPTAPLVLCLLDDRAPSPAIATLAGRLAGRHPVVLQRLEGDASLDGCHAVFVQRVAGERRQDLLRQAAGRSLLTVGDAPGFAAEGGVINIVPREQGLGFEVNLAAADAAHLQVSLQLLKLAQVIVGKVPAAAGPR